MKEIYLRVWIPERKKMDYIDLKSLLYEDGHYYSHNGVDPGFPVMLDTGKKDKNGKRIFGGDILDDWELGGEVYWNDEFAGFYIRNSHALALPINAVKYQQSVIGNVWENPELLEEK